MICPNCKSPEDHCVIWNTRNLGVVIINAGWYVFQVGALFWVVNRGWSFERKCLACGYRFEGEKPFLPNFDECAACGYDLTGNVSGRCSECGWRLPRRFRAYRRRKEREEVRKRRFNEPRS